MGQTYQHIICNIIVRWTYDPDVKSFLIENFEERLYFYELKVKMVTQNKNQSKVSSMRKSGAKSSTGYILMMKTVISGENLMKDDLSNISNSFS